MRKRYRVVLSAILAAAAVLALVVAFGATGLDRTDPAGPVAGVAHTPAAPDGPHAAGDLVGRQRADASQTQTGACGKTPKCQYRTCDDCPKNPANQKAG